jgi:hypothetical protein
MGKSEASEAALATQNTDVSTGDELSPFQRRILERRKAEVLMPVEDSYNKLYTVNPDAAEAFLNLHDMILPAQKDPDDPSPEDDSDLWLPSLIAIASRKAEKPEGVEAFNNAGDGGLYFHETRQAVPDDMLFYPLYSHVRHTWWGDGDRSGKVDCQSLDGVTGQRFHGPEAPGYFQCGTETCPNMPERYQESTDLCKYTRDFYVIDNKISNIYKFSLKYHSIKTFQDFMIKSTKRDNIKFNPKSGFWFKVRSYTEGAEGKKGWYFKATTTTEEIDPAQAHIIGQAKLLVKQFYKAQLNSIAKAASGKADASAEQLERIEAAIDGVGSGEDADNYADV